MPELEVDRPPRRAQRPLVAIAGILACMLALRVFNAVSVQQVDEALSSIDLQSTLLEERFFNNPQDYATLVKDGGKRSKILKPECRRVGSKPLPRLTHPRLVRGLSRDLENKTVHLLEVLQNVFHRANVTWMMYGGTLLGSLLFQDIIPWDDDIDLLVPDWQSERATKALTAHDPNTFGVYVMTRRRHNCTGHFLKFFFRHGYPLRNFPWTSPFLDIFWSSTTGDFTWENSYGIRQPKLYFPTSWLYPTQLRPLNRLMLPAPRHPLPVLRTMYRTFRCRVGSWNHTMGRGNKQATQVSCPALLPYNPVASCCAPDHQLMMKQPLTSIQQINAPVDVELPKPALTTECLDPEYQQKLYAEQELEYEDLVRLRAERDEWFEERLEFRGEVVQVCRLRGVPPQHMPLSLESPASTAQPEAEG